MPKEVRIVANWKMNKTVYESLEFINKLPIPSQPVMIAPPFVSLFPCCQNKPAMASIGAQNIYTESGGAFTGEISAQMVKDAGADFVILGHSERRQIFNETCHMVNQKVQQALLCDLMPIVCIGETATQREEGKAQEILKDQLLKSLKGIAAHNFQKMCIAYEPIWAIGTGLAATAQMTQETHFNLRSIIEEEWGTESAEDVYLLYGGSISPDNIEEFVQQPDIDGVLIGGASLNIDSFSKIIQTVGNITQ